MADPSQHLPSVLPDVETPEGAREVIRRGSDGDQSMRPLLRKLFQRDRRDGGRTTDLYGNIANHTAERMVESAAGDDIAMREAYRQKMVALRDELAGPSASPLERLLCERIALAWFDANLMDFRYSSYPEGLSFKEAAYREARRDRAHKRFLAACATLARIRRLGGPSIQFNVADRQVNVAL